MAEQLDKILYLSGVYGAEPYMQPNNIVNTPVTQVKQVSAGDSGRMIATYFERDVSRDITGTSIYANSTNPEDVTLTSYDYNVPIIQKSFEISVNEHDQMKKGKTVEQAFVEKTAQIQSAIRNIGQTMLKNTLTGAFDTALTAHDITDYESSGWDGNAIRKAKYDLFGEQANTIRFIVMHSAQLAEVLNKEVVPQYKGSETAGYNVELFNYNGMTLIVNDTLCAPTGAVYPTYLFGQGALGLTYRNQMRFSDVKTSLGGGTTNRVFTFDQATELLGVDYSGSYPTSDSDITTGSNYALVWDSKEVKAARVTFTVGA